GQCRSSVAEAIALAQAPAGDSSAITIASARQTDPKLLTRQLRGDLDWIVMKCLEKDRTRRYETANGLAMDVQRYLAGEPVVAAPASAGYRLRKFVRRHRIGVVGGSLVAATLIVGAIGTSAGLVWALRERDAAQAARAETERVATFQAEQLSGIDAQTMGVKL